MIRWQSLIWTSSDFLTPTSLELKLKREIQFLHPRHWNVSHYFLDGDHTGVPHPMEQYPPELKPPCWDPNESGIADKHWHGRIPIQEQTPPVQSRHTEHCILLRYPMSRAVQQTTGMKACFLQESYQTRSIGNTACFYWDPMSREYNKHWHRKRSENRPGKGIHFVSTLVTLEHIQCILIYVYFFMPVHVFLYRSSKSLDFCPTFTQTRRCTPLNCWTILVE